MARPTHSNDAPAFAFHMLSLRYALAMISIGIAVRMMIGPLPYAVAAASAARVSPTEAAGADAAMPMIVSSVTPMASASRWGPLAGRISSCTAAD